MNNEQEIQKTKTPDEKNRFLLVFLMILFIFLALGGYFVQDYVMQKIDNTEAKISKSLSDINSLQRKNEQLQNSLRDLQEEIQSFNLSKGQKWQPIVIEYLVRMAELALSAKGDAKEALSFLLAAKQYAKGTRLSAISHALNKDIASLQVVSAVDYLSLISKIKALGQRITILPMMIKKFEKSQQDESVSNGEDQARIGLWKRIFAGVQEALRNIVEIRSQNVEPLLSLEQENILRLNIKVNLLQAEVAVMERQDSIYQSCLSEVEILLKRYFSLNSKEVNGLISYIEELKKIELQPTLPVLNDSVSAVSRFIKSNSTKTSEKKSREGKQQISPKTKGARRI